MVHQAITTKALPEPMLTKICVIIWHHWAIVTFNKMNKLQYYIEGSTDAISTLFRIEAE